MEPFKKPSVPPLKKPAKKQRPKLALTASRTLKTGFSMNVLKSAALYKTPNLLSFGVTLPLPEISIKNMVCGVHVKSTFDLSEIYCRTRFSDYNPSRFSGCILKLRDPRLTAVVFASGKMILFGGTSEQLVDLGARKFIRIFQKIGYPEIDSYTFKIHNVIGVCNIQCPIYLENLYERHSQFCRYEPEIFPAVVYRLVKPRVVLLIFANGKVVITGAKSMNELNTALKLIYPILRSYRKCK